MLSSDGATALTVNSIDEAPGAETVNFCEPMVRPTRPVICDLPCGLVFVAAAVAPAAGTTEMVVPGTATLFLSSSVTVTGPNAASIATSGIAPLVTLKVRSFAKHSPTMQLLSSPQTRPSVALVFASVQVGGVVAQLSVPVGKGLAGMQALPFWQAKHAPPVQKL